MPGAHADNAGKRNEIQGQDQVMKSQLRHLIADALHRENAYMLPSVCERYGLEAGTGEEAFSSKRRYVLTRLQKLSDERVLAVAKVTVADYPDDKLQTAIEQLEGDGRLITDITRQKLAEAINPFALAGKKDLIELLRNHFPGIDRERSVYDFGGTLADDLYRHMVQNDDWSNEEVLSRAGFLTCSQARLAQFLEDVVHPTRRDESDQEAVAAALNPILRRDSYALLPGTKVSGYPVFKMREIAPTGIQPADDLISKTLVTFDESGVHAAWEKALERRANDPDGAITAARTLIETVCKHIIEEAGGSYGANDDLPKLYAIAADHLNLAPSQHSEPIFKGILGNCQAVVGGLAAVRNKLGDSHGQGKKAVRAAARHAEFAVNLAGSVATFLVATWNARHAQPSGRP